MLNKELLMGAKQGQRKVQLTIGAFTFPTGKAYGYNRADNVGSLDALPWWSSEIEAMNFLAYYTMFKRTSFKAPNGVIVFVEGYPQSISSDSWLDGDPYSMDGEIGGVRYLTFDPPPLQDISKKVKQVFTRSRKEGVVNAGEGNVGGRVYFWAHSHNKVSHGIGDGVGVSPNDLSPLWRVDLGESRRRYHHGHSDVRDRRGYKRPCFYPHFWRRPYTSNTRKYNWNIEHRSSARDYVLQDQRQIEGCVRRIHPLRNLGLSKEVPYAA